MNRRSFIKTTAGGLALAVSPALCAAEKSGIQLGLVTYNWGKDWDLPEILRQCAAANYSGVELRSTHAHKVEPNLSAAERREVAKRFADSPVKFVGPGTACEYHSADPAELQRNIEQTKAFVRLCSDLGG